jgi:alanine or glycine:cation symporter, AGCS family
VAHELGSGTTCIMSVLIFVFAFSSVLDNYSYAEVGMTFMHARPVALTVFRAVVLAVVGAGARGSAPAPRRRSSPPRRR